MMTSLQDNYRAAVFGASGGIGAALACALASDERCAIVHVGARRPTSGGVKQAPFAFDLTREDTIAAACQAIAADGPLDLIIVATGVLHGAGLAPEKTYRALSARALAHAFTVNTIGPALIAKHMLDEMPRNRRAIFAALSARVGSISDNRSGGWHAYRASKAALNQIVACLGLELARRNPAALALALHPGTVDTALSKPFQSAAAERVMFTPERSAAHLLAVMNTATPSQSGRLLAWDGAEIDP